MRANTSKRFVTENFSFPTREHWTRVLHGAGSIHENNKHFILIGLTVKRFEAKPEIYSVLLEISKSICEFDLITTRRRKVVRTK